MCDNGRDSYSLPFQQSFPGIQLMALGLYSPTGLGGEYIIKAEFPHTSHQWLPKDNVP